MTTPSSPAVHGRPGRLFLALGLAVAILAVVAYVIQLTAHRLTAPWYLPVAATAGVVLVAVSVWQARGIWRALALLLVAVIAGAAWTFLLGTRLPPYTGPVAV